MVMLDLRSMIACNNVARERMLALIEKYGHRHGRRGLRSADRAVGDAAARAAARAARRRSGSRGNIIDVNGETAMVCLTMTKKGDTLIFDFTGSSPQSRNTRSTARNGRRSAACSRRCFRCSATTSPGTRA